MFVKSLLDSMNANHVDIPGSALTATDTHLLWRMLVISLLLPV